MELKGTLHYDRLNFKRVYDMPIDEEDVFQDITDFIMDNRLGKEFYELIGVDYNNSTVGNDRYDIRSFVEDEIDEFEVTLGEHFPDVTFTIEEANDIYYNVEDVDEDLVDLCLTHVISRSDQIANFDFSAYYIVEASNDRELGEYCIDSYGGFDGMSRETIENYFDFERFGRDVRLEGSAIDCDGCFLMGG